MKYQAPAIPACAADPPDSAHETLKKVKFFFRALVHAARIEREAVKARLVAAASKRAAVLMYEPRGEELDRAFAEEAARRAQVGVPSWNHMIYVLWVCVLVATQNAGATKKAVQRGEALEEFEESDDDSDLDSDEPVHVGSQRPARRFKPCA
jgi:hypothetical protein